MRDISGMLLAFMWLAVSPALAQETESGVVAEQAEPATEETVDAGQDPAADDVAAAAAAAAAATATAEETDDDTVLSDNNGGLFVPSEEISADSAISFPADI